jgi:hypothetical protein
MRSPLALRRLRPGAARAGARARLPRGAWLAACCLVLLPPAALLRRDGASPAGDWRLLPPRAPSPYGAAYDITADFASAVARALPRVRADGRVAFALAGSGVYAYYAANLLCSLRALNISSVLWVGTSARAFAHLRRLPCAAVRWRAECPRDIFYLTMIKWFVARYLLSLGCEVFYCDTDAVFLADPRRLFVGGADVEFAPEFRAPAITAAYPVRGVNCGHIRWAPTARAAAFADDFVAYAFGARMRWSARYRHDQTILTAYLAGRRSNFTGRVFVLDTGLRIAFFDPVLAAIGSHIMVRVARAEMGGEAQRRGLARPVLFHLAYYAPQRKPSVFGEKNLWFVDFPRALVCKQPPPSGTPFFWKKELNVPTEIPMHFVWNSSYLDEEDGSGGA